MAQTVNDEAGRLGRKEGKRVKFQQGRTRTLTSRVGSMADQSCVHYSDCPKNLLWKSSINLLGPDSQASVPETLARKRYLTRVP